MCMHLLPLHTQACICTTALPGMRASTYSMRVWTRWPSCGRPRHQSAAAGGQSSSPLRPLTRDLGSYETVAWSAGGGDERAGLNLLHLMWHASDTIARPLVGNRAIERVGRPACDPAALPFPALVRADLLEKQSVAPLTCQCPRLDASRPGQVAAPCCCRPSTPLLCTHRVATSM